MIYAICILCPPLALLLMGRGLHALLNIPLTLLFWLPGVVHAWAVIARREREYRDERLACILKGVTPPPPPGTVPNWVSAAVIIGTITFFAYLALNRPQSLNQSDQITQRAGGSSPSAPATPAQPQPGALFAEVVASFGEPNLAQKETGWAYWNGFKGRFQDGRLVEVVDAAETAAK